MLFENEHFTDRQKDIIKKIGKEQRKSIDKEKKKFQMTYGFIIVFLIALGIVLGITSDNIFLMGFLAVSTVGIFGVNIFKKNKDMNELKTQDDYHIGLYFADTDIRVKGNADKKLKGIKLSGIIIASCFFLMIILILGINLGNKPIDFGSLISVQGSIKDAKINSNNDSIEITFANDNHVYIIDSLFFDDFDWEEFGNVSDKNDIMNVLCTNTSDSKRHLYYAEVNGIILLTKEEVIKTDEENRNLGWIMLGLFSLGSAVSIAFVVIYKHCIYKKHKAKEVYDLNFSDEEVKAIFDNDTEIPEETIKKHYIKTSYPKGILWFFLVTGMIALGLILGGAFLKDKTGMWVLIGIGIFFLLLTLIGLFDIFKNYEVLDGNTLIVNRFFKTKRITASEIKIIRMKGEYTVFIDKNGKTLCRIASMTAGLGDIIIALQDMGIRIELHNLL